METEDSSRRIKVLVFQAACSTAIDGICILCSEAFYVKMVRAAADFLIGSKPDFYGGHEAVQDALPISGPNP